MIVRDRKSENLSIDLILSLHKTEELNNASYHKGYTISVLAIYNV